MFQIHSCAPHRSTTTTAARSMVDLTDDVMADTEGPGAQKDETDVSGC